MLEGRRGRAGGGGAVARGGGGAVARGGGGRICARFAPFLKKLKIFWKARNTRKVSAGYMICVTFARAQIRRKTGALFVAGQC